MDEEGGEDGNWNESSAALGEFGDGDEAVGARSITGKKRRAVVVETAPVRVNPRQTLLFSATLLSQESNKRATGPNAKGAAGRNKTVDARFDGAVTVRPHAAAKKLLPEFLRQLVDAVAIQKSVTIVNAATANRIARATEVAAAASSAGTAVAAKENRESSGLTTTAASQAESVQLGAATLPKGLVQVEVKMPTEEKDVIAYYYLITNPSRTLVFVNSIKTARRLDGLLRALGLNCRTVHSQLQQRQRLRALDSFRASPIGVLVATDIAARGLDIPKVQHVVHYDIARSAQVYVHRSGRTARASATGTAVSLVTPLDEAHHADICRAQGLMALPPYRVDLAVLPDLRSHVNMAKKIFTKSFVLSQKQKTNNWLADTVRGTGLDLDDDVLEGDADDRNNDENDQLDDDNRGGKRSRMEVLRAQQQAVERDRREMKVMIEQSAARISKSRNKFALGKSAVVNTAPVATAYKRRRGPFIVVAK